MKTIQFELNEVIIQEANELAAARQKAFLVHHTKDIDAAGDEVEIIVRDFVKRRLPVSYYVGHGHIVDNRLNCNGQHDLIIADNTGSPVLFTAKNGTEYFPYESVYAFGEIKSTYNSSKTYMQDFITRTEKLYNNLERVETPNNQISQTLKVGEGLSNGDAQRPNQSQLFKFMFFVNGGNFKPEQLKQVFQGANDKYLPNVIIILDQGVVVKCLTKDENGVPLNVVRPMAWPELIEFGAYGKPEQFEWVFFANSAEGQAATGLSYLYFLLNQHLRDTLLLRPDFQTYFFNIGLLPLGQGTPIV